MTAIVSLEQFVHLKQPTSDYPSQTYQISFNLYNLIKSLKEILLLTQDNTKSPYNLLNKELILIKDFEGNLCQITGIKRLRQAAKDNLFKALKALKTLKKMEVTYA